MKYKLYKLLPVLILLLSLILACEDQLPSDFQTSLDHQMLAVDQTACHFLSRDLTRTDTVVVGKDTTFTTHRFYVPVVATGLSQSLEEAWVNAGDEFIRTQYDTLAADTTLLVSNPETETMIYALFPKPTGLPAKTIFFLSWELTEENYDAYIDVKIYAKSGKEIPMQSADMQLETIAGCTQKIQMGGATVAVPAIRARFVYSVDAGAYLVRFSLSEPASIGAFRLVLL